MTVARDETRTFTSMLLTNHVLAGALVGALSRNETTAFTAGVISHFALDSLPHFGVTTRKGFWTTAVIDGLVGAAVMSIIAAKAPKDRRGRVVAGMLGSCLPDANKPANEFFGASPFPAVVDKFHGAIQDEDPSRLGQEFVVATLAGAAVIGALREHVDVPRSTRRSRRKAARA